MNRKSLFTTLALLSATALGGCASQNAMDSLPSDVRLAVTADQIREKAPAEAAAPRETAALSDVEREYRRRQAEAAPQRVAEADPLPAAAAAPADDAVALFNRAREMQALRDIPTEAPSPDGIAAPEAPTRLADAEQTWQKALAMHKAAGTPSVADLTALPVTDDPAQAEPLPDQTITTASLQQQPAGDDMFEFVVEPGAASLPQASAMELRLKAMGGRTARRIVIGRLPGTGFDVLASAQALARLVAASTGGEPGMSYEPSMSEGAVRVEYEPFAGKVN